MISNDLTKFADELHTLLIKYDVELYYEPACYQVQVRSDNISTPMALCNGEVLSQFTFNPSL